MATATTARPLPPRRDFALLDLLTLVAAMAAAFALSRPDFEPRPLVPSQVINMVTWNRPRTWLGQVYVRADLGLQVGSKVASMLMLGLIVVSLRPPRPGLRRLSRRPGFVACVAAASALAVNALIEGAVATFQSVPIPGVWNPFEPICRARIGPAVVGTWLFLGLGGHWRADKGLIDRSGRLLGLFWIVEVAWPYFDRYAVSRLPASWWTW